MSEPKPTNGFVYGETPVMGIRPLDVDAIKELERQNRATEPDPAPPLVNEVKAEREKYAALVKRRLASKQVTELEARDGLRDCFVATYLGGVAQGLDNFELQGDVKQVKGVVEAIFRRRLKAHGTSWESPTVGALQAVKDEIDVETHLDALPAELKGVHDQVCTLLIGKARGDVGHVGDRSAVAAAARGEVTTVPSPATPTPAVAPVAAAPAVAAERANTPEASAPETPAQDPVTAQMRATVATLLEQMAAETRKGASVDALFERAGQLTGLIDTLQQLSR